MVGKIWTKISQLHKFTCPLFFQHIATQVVVDLSAGEGLQLDSLVSAIILPPTPGASLDIETGIIEATDTYDTTPLNMGKNGFLAQAIVLPTRATTPMSMTLKILADGETTPRTYTGSIPIPVNWPVDFLMSSAPL